MEPAVYRSVARRRDSRHGTAITPFSAWQGGAASWRVGVLKADGSLDDLYGVTALILRISSYGGTAPGAFSWVAKTVSAAEFLTPTSAAAVQAGTEWHAEVQLTEEETILPVEDAGSRPYWWEWRAVTAAGEVPLSAGQLVVRGNSGRAGAYALSADVTGESEAREVAIATEAAARIAAITAESAARSAAVTALSETAADLADGQASAVARIDSVEAAFAGKVDRSLANAQSEAVGTRLIAPAAVTLEKLDPALRSSIGSGLNYDLFQSTWDPTTDTPTIPAAAGNDGKWYYVDVAGTAAGGNAAGTYARADRIVSNGAAWVRLRVAETIIQDGSLSLKAIADYEVRNDAQLGNGATIIESWATEDGTESIATIDSDGKMWPHQAAAEKTRLDALEPKTQKLGLGLLPLDWLENVEHVEEGVWILNGDGEHVQIIDGLVTEDGTELIDGTGADDIRYPIQAGGGTSDYEPPDYVVYPQDGGGVAMADGDGESPVIEESATWRGLQPTAEDGVWIGSSNRLGAYRTFLVNVPERAVAPKKPTLLLHFGITGQSLAAGGSGGPEILTTTALHPDHNLMFNGGLGVGMEVSTINISNVSSFAAMLQTVWSGRTYETAWPGFMNCLQAKIKAAMGVGVKILCSNHASGGKTYAQIKKGTNPYNNGLTEVTRAKAIAASLDWEYLYAGTMLVHGENDRLIGTTAAAYDGYIKELLADETADIQAITGQSHSHKIYTDQCHSWTAYNFTVPTVTLGQLSACLTSSRVSLACPKYIFTYSDGIHLYNVMYRRLGEYHAKAVFADLFGPGGWKPFCPVEVGQTSEAVWLRMQTPQGHSMTFDTTLVSNPGNYGFELAGATISGTPTISGDIVMIPKTGTATEVRYAHTGTAGQDAGPTTGARGCLRDTDPSISDFEEGFHLYNYCLTFAQPVPPAS